MSTRPARHLLASALLVAALAACGGDGDAAERAGGGEPAVYTSEVESVSRWIQQGGGSADSAGLVATPNPRGEGVLVYSRGADSAAGGQRAAWVVVDSQVVPLNQASRRAAPRQAQQPQDDERTWQRIGIERAGGEADLRDILPVPEAPPTRERPAPKQREAPAVPAPDATAPVPFPAEPPTPRATGPRDTLRIPAGSGGAGQGGARRDSSAGDPVRAPDSLRVPVTRPARDTLRIPGPSAGEAAPAAEPAAATPLPPLPGA
ncbi:MAG: hypothetical protein AB1941_13205 [Gemmatimonadota bacterium]